MNRAVLKIVCMTVLPLGFGCAISASAEELALEPSPPADVNRASALSNPPLAPRSDDYYNLGTSRSLHEHQPKVLYSYDPLNFYQKTRKISIFALLANGSFYQDKMVSVIGYLRSERGCNGQQIHYLYPTREAYEVNDRRESICLNLNPLFKGSTLFEDGSRIEAVGIFAQSRDCYNGILNKGSMRLLKVYSPYPQVGGQEGPVPVK